MAFREARSAVGASKVLAGAEEYATVAEAVADCTLVVGTTAVGRRVLAASAPAPGTWRAPHPQAAGVRRVALLFGSEKCGLSNEDLSHCHWLLHIPTSAENISMNLGQAVAVCLYELVRDPKAQRQSEKQAPAVAGDLERITAVLFDALYASGFLTRKPTTDAEERVRRLVRRLKLPARDVASWLGILRQIVWKLRTPAGKPR